MANNEEKLCHYCEEYLTDFTCDVCGEPTCESCCVQMTYHNQIDYPLCLGCEETRQAESYLSRHAEWEAEKKAKAKKDAASAKRRANYRKPENIEKRRLAKIQRQKDRYGQHIEHMKSSARIVNDMFRNFF